MTPQATGGGQDGAVPPPNRKLRTLTRADLPSELTPETLRHVGLRTLGEFARRGNGVLDAEEQRQFDSALATLRRGANSLVDESLQRAGRVQPGMLDPSLRRSYERTQQRLAAQAERARRRFPELGPDAPADQSPADQSVEAAPGDDGSTADATDDDAAAPDVSTDTLEQEVTQTSETLDMLERIASLQQQLLEHQQRQVLSETRGLFFGFLVSVTVIVAGVAPLVEAEPHTRLLIVVWTVAVTLVAAGVYALVRARQAKN